MKHILHVAIAVITVMVWASCDPITTQQGKDDVHNGTEEVKPELVLLYSKSEDSENISVFSDMLACETGDKYILSVEDMIDSLTYTMYSADESVFTIEQSSKSSWTITATAPGVTDLQVSLAQPNGKEWIYNYEAAAYGHISFESKCNPVERTAGFVIGDIEYEGLRANMTINTKVVGWPWGITDQKYSVKPDEIKQVLPLDAGEDYSYIIDLDAAFQEIYDLGYETNSYGDNAWWSPYQLKMDIVISLNNPYVIVDDIIDDADRERPDYINFETLVTFKQEGLAMTSSNDDIGNNDGWVDQNVYVDF